MAAAASPAVTFPTADRRKARLTAVVGAVLAVPVVWALARLAVSDLRQPGFGGAKPHRLALVLMHLTVAGIVIPVLYRSSRPTETAAQR
jgi:hypothetical protein